MVDKNFTMQSVYCILYSSCSCLRYKYNYAIKLAARTCACGQLYSINYCLTCGCKRVKRGGYVVMYLSPC